MLNYVEIAEIPGEECESLLCPDCLREHFNYLKLQYSDFKMCRSQPYIESVQVSQDFLFAIPNPFESHQVPPTNLAYY